MKTVVCPYCQSLYPASQKRCKDCGAPSPTLAGKQQYQGFFQALTPKHIKSFLLLTLAIIVIAVLVNWFFPPP